MAPQSSARRSRKFVPTLCCATNLSILLLLTTIALPMAEAKWYAQICPTGSVEAVKIDTETGQLTFVDWPGGSNESNISTATPNHTSPPDMVMENEDDNRGETSIPAGGGNRYLRQQQRNSQESTQKAEHTVSFVERLLSFFTFETQPDLSQYTSTPAMRLSDFPAEEKRRILQEMVVEDMGNSNSTSAITTDTTIVNYEDGQVFYIRPCLCYNGSNRYSSSSSSSPDATTTSASGSTADELYLCHAEASYCGVPLDDDSLYNNNPQSTDDNYQFPQTPSPTAPPASRDPVACYSVNMQQVVARNAWPLILLWYFGLLVICACTIHGHTAGEYLKSWLCPGYNERFLDRMLDPEQNRNRTYNWWSWQRHRFEENLILQVQWIWRHEEYQRERRRRQQGLPPPQLELKVKRWTNPDGNHDNNGDETDQMNDAVTLEMTPLSTPSTSEEMPSTEETVRISQGEDGDEGTAESSDDNSDANEEAEDDKLEANDTSPSGDDASSINSYDTPSCTICFAPLEEGDRIGDLSCNHEFHVDCLKTWVQRKNACPLCNVPIGKRSRQAPRAHPHEVPESNNDTNNNNNQTNEDEESVDDFTQYYRDRLGRRRRRRRFGESLSRLPSENRRIGMIGVTMDWDADETPADEYGNNQATTRQ